MIFICFDGLLCSCFDMNSAVVERVNSAICCNVLVFPSVRTIQITEKKGYRKNGVALNYSFDI